jgi:glycosyltransferase involved in cell wall biosynthesis
MRRLLHVAQINFRSDPAKREPAALLQAWRTVVDVAEAAASASDVKVSVVQASPHWTTFERGGVAYHFLPCGQNASTRAGRAAFRALLRELGADVLHVQGLGFASRVLAAAAAAPHTPILLQDHAARPPPFWRRAQWRRGLAAASGIAFCAREQAAPFVQRALVPAHTAIYEIPESTCRFTPGERAQARQATGLSGDPCLLWVGHLNENKDPLTVLDGIAKVAARLPGLELWCCFGTAPLLHDVQRRVAADPRLVSRVHLLGRLPHERIETAMRAADFLVQGSHREGSGYAVIEALACGLTPIVTDIPSFRALLGPGAELWRCGDADDFARTLLRLAAEPQAALRAAARRRFDEEISSDALGRKLRAVYAELAGKRERECAAR